MGRQTECQEMIHFPLSRLGLNGNTSCFHLQYLQDPARAALFGKPSKGKAIAGKGTGKAQKGNESSDYDSDSEDLSESEGSDIK